jgi:hypothetical protein
MDPQERQLVVILADISGYTRFVLENQTAAVHALASPLMLGFIALLQPARLRARHAAELRARSRENAAA